MGRDRWTNGTGKINIAQMNRTNERLIQAYNVACVHLLTFFVKIFCIAKVKVANKALSSPTRSKDNSVAVAIITPPTTGINEQ